MTVWIYAVGALGLILAGAVAWLAHDARDLVRRLDRHPTRLAGALEAGPVEVAGTLRAVGEPLRTFAGTKAIAVRTVLGMSIRSGDQSVDRPEAVDRLEATPAELTDAGGRCVVDVDHAVLFGPREVGQYEAGVFRKHWPELFEKLGADLEGHVEITRVEAVQTFIPEGCAGFVAGLSEPVPGARRFRIGGSSDAPIIVSSFPEAVVRRHFARPSLVHACLSILLVLVAAFLFAAPSVLEALSR